MSTNPKTIGESTMKEIQNLPDDNTLDELIVMAEFLETNAKDLYHKITQIDDRLRSKLHTQRQETIQSSKK